MEIVERFAADKPDVLFHLHCDPDDPESRDQDYCYSLRDDLRCLGLDHIARFTAGLSDGKGIPLRRLAALYQAADVHLLASYGEGFGLPTLQASAAGAVPLATDYSASRELVQGHGGAVRVRDFVATQSGLRCALVDIDDAVRKLERLYRDRRLLASKSHTARRFARSYDWQRILPLWHDLFERVIPEWRAAQTSRRPGRSPNGSRPSRPVAAIHRTKLASDVPTIIRRLEHIGGHVTAGILRDLADTGSPFALPVTLPLADPRRVERRVTGRVYLASSSDTGVFLELRRISRG